MKTVRTVFKPATIPCGLLLPPISSSNWLQSCSQSPPSLPPLYNTASLRWPFHFPFLTLWHLLLWLCSLLLFSLSGRPSPPLPAYPYPLQPSQPPPGHSRKCPPNRPGRASFSECLCYAGYMSVIGHSQQMTNLMRKITYHVLPIERIELAVHIA